MARKHYRAFKKEVEANSTKGTFIPNSQKSRLFGISSIFVGLTFIVGTLIGFILGKKDD